MTNTSNIWAEAPNPNEGEFSAIARATHPDLIRQNFNVHHATFITEDDIAAIAAAGLNTVRVPLGWWIPGFDDYDPSNQGDWKVYSAGTIQYLDLLVNEWALKYNVAVLLDVHAAKGSQNGKDHSSPSVPGKTLWDKDSSNVQNTIALVTFLVQRYKDQESFLGFGLLNEPDPDINKEVLYNYYQSVYKAVRDLGSDCVLAIAPVLTEQKPGFLTDFMVAPLYTNVKVDWHKYTLWGYDIVSDVDLVDVTIKQDIQNSIMQWNAVPDHNALYIGEWSLATTDRFKNDTELFYRFAEAYVTAVNQAAFGWTYWSWKKDWDHNTADMWSLRSVLRDERLKAILLSANS
ncbi:hypothetical protein PsorP6_011284 [Peronosclerospora sorghi]|uniref:Uncharacterized protein n=1 Tax=Peronosclerospora sorghi TaxID=230839 RepID=A0ACC0WHH2_9STRA|nr:hypothetical protein PsorP6_011284 [Peronosclerospora sorghi]